LPTHPTPHRPGDIRDLLGVLRRRKWSIILVAALTVGAVLAFSYRQTPVYDATSQVLVKPASLDESLQGISVASLVSMDTERTLAESSAVAHLAAERLGTLDAQEVQDAVSVTVPTNTQFLNITYSDPNPETAQAGAQAVANGYLRFREEEALQDAAAAAQGYQQRIDELETELHAAQQDLAGAVNEADIGSGNTSVTQTPSEDAIVAQAEVNRLQGEIDLLGAQLSQIRAQSIDAGTIVANATLPTSPASPNHIRNGLLALVAGVALGVGLAFLRERLDDRLSGREDFEGQAGAPVLSVVPKLAGWKRRDRAQLAALSMPKSPPAEAYRTIRTNLQFTARNTGFKILAVTSPSLGEGKTTTVANLAVTIAQSGKRVIAVSCDLRKPRLHRFFDLDNDVGVTTVLAGEATMASAAQRVERVETLRVLASGPIPSNPAELLGSHEMDGLFSSLREQAEFVLLDTAPALAVSDALIVAPIADGVLLIADADTTTRAAVAHVREQLEQVGANIVGGVLNNFDPSNAKYYPSYYRSYYSYQYRPETSEPRPRDAKLETLHKGEPEDLWR
jgi:tyrosine-protein kinase